MQRSVVICEGTRGSAEAGASGCGCLAKAELPGDEELRACVGSAMIAAQSSSTGGRGTEVSRPQIRQTRHEGGSSELVAPDFSDAMLRT